jgi:hypothetical protein
LFNCLVDRGPADACCCAGFGNSIGELSVGFILLLVRVTLTPRDVRGPP